MPSKYFNKSLLSATVSLEAAAPDTTHDLSHWCECACACVQTCTVCVCASVHLPALFLGAVQHVQLCGGDAGSGAGGCVPGCGEVLRGRARWDGFRRPVRLRGRLHHEIHVQGPGNRATLHIHVQLPGLSGGRALRHLIHHGVSRC